MSQSKKKVRLDLDAIEVETFVTHDQQGSRGTVFGYATDYWTCANPCDTNNGTCYTAAPNITCDFNAGCQGEASALCQSAGCTNNTCYNTCNCANDSAPGYASCGTTCANTACLGSCDSQQCYTSACGTSTCGCADTTGVNTCNAA